MEPGGWYAVNWGISFKREIEKAIETNFPRDLYSWPLLKGHVSEPFILQGLENYIVVVLKDRIEGGMAFSGDEVKTLDLIGAPKDPPSQGNIEHWQNYLNTKFSLRFRDAAFIIPDKESGTGQGEDWKIWNELDRILFFEQVNLVILRQHG
jgi:hypothetical protein